MLMAFIPWLGDIINFLLVLWMIAYLPIAMKRMYNKAGAKRL
jgi:hypothetical protein